MNLEESSEGSSCNGQENGDGFDGSERPLKKARFAWQVKGKYHLKKENNDSNEISNNEPTTSDTAGPSGSGSNSNNSRNIATQQHIQTIDGYILNEKLETLESIVQEPDESVVKPQESRDYNFTGELRSLVTPREIVVEDILRLNGNFRPRDETIFEPIDAEVENSQDSLSNYVMLSQTDDFEFLPAPTVTPKVYTEDQCIARWQARQMARGPLDNTLNTVLDYMKQEEDNSTPDSFDEEDSINDLPEVNSIENEGILMAISAHGLQNTSNSSSSSMNMDNEDLCIPGITSPAPRNSTSPIHSDVESHEESPHEIEYALDNQQRSCSDELKKEGNETIPPATFHGTTSLTFQNLYENLHNPVAAPNDVAIIEDDIHHDVLDAAVLYAIQSRGLTTFGTDYG